MMAEHKFGGDWTQEKLSCLEKYLNAYRHIFTQNDKAKFLSTWYVDAFAGTGARTQESSTPLNSPLFDDVYTDVETTRYLDGSAKIALGLSEPFDRYLFIEKSRGRVTELHATIEHEYQPLLPRCEFRQGDANEELKQWCRKRNWKKERAVVFLDPYGMQVEWSTIQALARTESVDLWYLFPLGVGVMRLLTYRGNIDEAWQRRLDLLFGTPEWRTEFYRVTPGQPDLWGETHNLLERDAPVEKIEAFIHNRLAGTFKKAAKGKVLRNSRLNPMYLLCFAAANERGAPTAIRIAQDILDD